MSHPAARKAEVQMPTTMKGSRPKRVLERTSRFWEARRVVLRVRERVEVTKEERRL